MFSDDKTTVSEIKEKLRHFVKERDWDKYHNHKDLALALSIEVSEVLEHFRFKTDLEIEEYLKGAKNKEEVAHELADCLSFLVRLADKCNVDLAESLERKMEINAQKYPAEKFKGNYKKYDKAE